VRANVDPGSTLITNGHGSYLNFTDYHHDAHVVTNIPRTFLCHGFTGCLL
jgi:hypothetical protein